MRKGWTGDGFDAMFQQQLISLSSSLATSAEQHLAYPLLHYFHSGTRDLAASVAIGHLDEALTLMETLTPSLRPRPAVVDPLRLSIGRYLSTASSTTWAPKVGAPPPPETSQTIDAGIPAATPTSTEPPSTTRNAAPSCIASWPATAGHGEALARQHVPAEAVRKPTRIHDDLRARRNMKDQPAHRDEGPTDSRTHTGHAAHGAIGREVGHRPGQHTDHDDRSQPAQHGDPAAHGDHDAHDAHGGHADSGSRGDC